MEIGKKGLLVVALATTISCASPQGTADLQDARQQELCCTIETVDHDDDPCNVPWEEFTEIRNCSSNEECPTEFCVAVVGAVEKDGVCALRTEQCPAGWVREDLYVKRGKPHPYCLVPHCVPKLAPAEMICGGCGWTGCLIQLQSMEEYPSLVEEAEGVCVMMEELRPYCSIPCDEMNPCPQGAKCAEMWVPSKQQYGNYCKPVEPCESEAGQPGTACSKDDECFTGWCLADPTSDHGENYCTGSCFEVDCGPPDSPYMCRCIGMWCPEGAWLCVLKAGWPCSNDWDCAEGYICRDDLEKPECWPPGLEGEPCLYSDDCGDGLYCDSSEEPPACRLGDRGAQGLSCKQHSECQQGLVCNQAANSGFCLPPGDDGAPCSKNADCQSGLVCNHVTDPGKCMPPGEPAAPCSATGYCKPSLVCNTAYTPNLCRPPGDVGDKCKIDSECLSSLICHFGYSPLQCQNPSQEGELCMYHSDCAQGLTCNWEQLPPFCAY